MQPLQGPGSPRHSEFRPRQPVVSCGGPGRHPGNCRRRWEGATAVPVLVLGDSVAPKVIPEASRGSHTREPSRAAVRRYGLRRKLTVEGTGGPSTALVQLHRAPAWHRATTQASLGGCKKAAPQGVALAGQWPLARGCGGPPRLLLAGHG